MTTARNSSVSSSSASPAQWLAQSRPSRRTWMLVTVAVCLECELQEAATKKKTSAKLGESPCSATCATQVFKWENLHLSFFTYLTHHHRCHCHCPNHCAPNSWAWHWSWSWSRPLSLYRFRSRLLSAAAAAHLAAMRSPLLVLSS